ncbi:Methyltransferase-like protein 17, mitochondrial [Trichinella sp. T8]|nr:Methyltransferase-like protein 17, mitochondrial [Trichinella sp. T8]
MSLNSVEDVVIDEGTFKYILLLVKSSSSEKFIVRGFSKCEYHDDILQEVSPEIIGKGMQVKCVGGGRINHDSVNRTLDVYGYSVGFGKADHEKTVSILKKRFPDYNFNYFRLLSPLSVGFCFSTQSVQRSVNCKQCKIVVDANIEKTACNPELKFKPRKHPGRFSSAIVDLPDELHRIILNVLDSADSMKIIKLEARKLNNFLSMRKPPASEEEIRNEALKIFQTLHEQDRIKAEKGGNQWPPADESDKDKELRQKNLRGRMLKKLKSVLYYWKPKVYNTETKCLAYLMARFASQYAVMKRILDQIKARNPEICPEHVFDFGSGVGSTFWACESTWPGKISEYYMVDVSSKMNDLALKLLTHGQPFGNIRHDNVNVRQFLPVQHDRKYDFVIAANVLIELESNEQRLYVIDNLWRKTNIFFIIIENGSKSGNGLVLEARNYILQKYCSTNSPDDLRGHVYAPCAHQFGCPREEHPEPCNFPVTYLPLKIPGCKREAQTELFSYVIMKKGSQSGENMWPRLVRQPQIRRRHIWCELCTEHGFLERVVVTKRRSGKLLYHMAKNSEWGDLLPSMTSDRLPEDDTDDISPQECDISSQKEIAD